MVKPQQGKSVREGDIAILGSYFQFTCYTKRKQFHLWCPWQLGTEPILPRFRFRFRSGVAWPLDFIASCSYHIKCKHLLLWYLHRWGTLFVRSLVKWTRYHCTKNKTYPNLHIGFSIFLCNSCTHPLSAWLLFLVAARVIDLKNVIVEPRFILWGHWNPLFWISDDFALMFQSHGGLNWIHWT